MHNAVLLVPLMSILTCCCGNAIVTNQGLYPPGGHVDIFWSTNFKENVFHQSHASVIEFYSAWCGYCQRFAPVWQNLAEDVHEWIDIVRIGSVDCGNETNFELCKEFEILSYPQLKVFHIGYEEGEGQTGHKMSKNFDGTLQRHILIQELIKEYQEGRAGENWPELDYYDAENVTTIWNGLPTFIEHVFLIFQEDNSTFEGYEVMLDLQSLKNIVIRVVLDETGLGYSLRIRQRPGLVAISRDNDVIPLTLGFKTRESIKMTIKSFLKSRNLLIGSTTESDVIFATETPNLNISKEREINKINNSSRDIVYQADILAALRYTIYREIPRNTEISGEKLIALKKYIRILSKYLTLNREVKILLTDLKYEVNQVQTEISGTSFMSLVKSLDQDKVLFVSNKWLGCSGSQQGFRGFPCGLWTLFHHLTVSAAYDKNADPWEVLQAMYGYIKYFFGCEECSKHFLEMADRNKILNVTSTDEAVIWLWSAHNEVNKRLSGDSTEDPAHPKIQYPRKENCPGCRNGASWDYLAVLSYLKKSYFKVVLDQDLDSSSSMLNNQTEIFPQKDCFNRKTILCLVRLYKDDTNLFPDINTSLSNGTDMETQSCYSKLLQCRSIWVSLIQKEHNETITNPFSRTTNGPARAV